MLPLPLHSTSSGGRLANCNWANGMSSEAIFAGGRLFIQPLPAMRRLTSVNRRQAEDTIFIILCAVCIARDQWNINYQNYKKQWNS